MKKSDLIFIRGQRVCCHIGVPDAERAEAQELVIHTSLSPQPSAEPLQDEIGSTIDYHAVSIRVEEIASSHPRKLIETLAEDLAGAILEEFPVRKVTIEIEKFILPNTRCVGVRVSRKAARGSD